MIHTKPPLTGKLSIYSDIFEFARTSTGKRDSVAAVLLHTVCPVAARLYLSDISPMEVPDITTSALPNYCRGGTWETAVCLKSFVSMMDDYILNSYVYC